MHCIFKNRSFPASFLFIFVLFKHKVYSWIWTQIVGIEGEHADHLTTTTAHRELVFALIFRATNQSTQKMFRSTDGPWLVENFQLKWLFLLFWFSRLPLDGQRIRRDFRRPRVPRREACPDPADLVAPVGAEPIPASNEDEPVSHVADVGVSHAWSLYDIRQLGVLCNCFQL